MSAKPIGVPNIAAVISPGNVTETKFSIDEQAQPANSQYIKIADEAFYVTAIKEDKSGIIVEWKYKAPQ